MFIKSLFLLSLKDSSDKDKEKEELAAVKIQALFRGHLAREEVKKMKQEELEEKTQEDN